MKEIRELIACFDESGPKLTVPEILARMRVIEGRLADLLAQQTIGFEKYVAIREGHRNACEEAYFGARPDLPLATITLTVFRHGFDRRYDLAATPQPAQRKPLTYCQECMRPNPIDGAACFHGIKE